MKSSAQIISEYIDQKGEGFQFTSRILANVLGIEIHRASAAVTRLDKVGKIEKIGKLDADRHQFVYKVVDTTPYEGKGSVGLGCTKQRGSRTTKVNKKEAYPIVSSEKTLADKLLALAVEAEKLKPLSEYSYAELVAELSRRQLKVKL